MNKKTLIIILAIVGVLCLCAIIAGVIIFTQAGKLVSENVSTDSGDVQESAAAIAEYTLPAGYTETFGMNIFGVSMVGFSSGDKNQTLMMYQFPASQNMDSEELAEQMRQMSEESDRPNQQLAAGRQLPGGHSRARDRDDHLRRHLLRWRQYPRGHGSLRGQGRHGLLYGGRPAELLGPGRHRPVRWIAALNSFLPRRRSG